MSISLHPTVFSPTQFQNSTTYLHHLSSVLAKQNFSVNSSTLSAISQLRKKVIQLEVKQIKQTALAQGIWDFYPTTKPLITKMLQIAQVKSSHRILEPSAGSGDLACAIANLGVQFIDCFEIHPLLQTALKLQGFNLIGDNFLNSSPQPIYDRIIANPPFSNNGVAHHLTHAYNFLKPGGILLSLSHHYQLKPSQTDRQFFAWLKSKNARFLNCGRAFSQSDKPNGMAPLRSTHVPLQIIFISKRFLR
jgi:protein-L-isoaspartate O-methyltransferase